MGQEPVPERPPFFIQIFCFGNEVQFRDVDPCGADRVAELATDTEIDPLIGRGFARFSKPLGPWAGLFRSREEGGDPGDRTDGHTGGTPDTRIGVILGPEVSIHRQLISPQRQQKTA